MGVFSGATDEERRTKAMEKDKRRAAAKDFRNSEEQRKALQAAARERDGQRKALEAAATAFWQSAQGRARTAKHDGQTFFQLMLPLASTSRSWNSLLFGDVATTTRNRPEQGAVLTQIESEGWELFQAGFVFQETGAVSRDKLLSSGQSVQTTGDTQGVYLFRVTGAAPRVDTPWVTSPSQRGDGSPL
jgi:hypothetical protein